MIKLNFEILSTKNIFIIFFLMEINVNKLPNLDYFSFHSATSMVHKHIFRNAVTDRLRSIKNII